MDLHLFVLAFAAALAVGTINAQNKIVEVLIVFDDYSYAEWEEVAAQAGNTLYDEVYSMFDEANMVMTEGLGIELRVSEVGIINIGGDIFESIVVDEATDVIDTDLAIEMFRVIAQNDLQGVFEHDAALMMVGHYLGYNDSTSGVNGVTYRSGMCSEYSVALIASRYIYEQVHTIYHELVHLLGSTHDGNGNDCPAEEGWAMTPSPSPYNEHYFEYSECSKDFVEKFLSSRKGYCLDSTSGSIQINAERWGRLVDGDEQCIRMYGPESFGVQTYDTGMDICQAYVCAIGDLLVNNAFTPQGLPCGPGQSCNFGLCSDDPTVPIDFAPNCLFGDSPNVYKLASNYATCADVVAAGACDGDGLEGDICCRSCAESVTIGK